jgi:hypothetical protein
MIDLALYEQHRPQMHTGDRLGWRSDTIIGRLIRLVTRQKVNHTGMIIRFHDFDTVCTAEALEDGFHLQRLSRRLLRHRGQVYHYPLRPEYAHLTTDLGRSALEFAGVEYDYKSLFKQILRRVAPDPAVVFCSEAIYLIGLKAGLPPNPDQQTAPQPGADMDRLGWWGEEVRIL